MPTGPSHTRPPEQHAPCHADAGRFARLLLAGLLTASPLLVPIEPVEAAAPGVDSTTAPSSRVSAKTSRKRRPRPRRPRPPKPKPEAQAPEATAPPEDATVAPTEDESPEPSEAEEMVAAEEVSEARPWRLELPGFVLSRFVGATVDRQAGLAGILPSRAASRAFIEANLQPRLATTDRSLTLAVDASGYASTMEPKTLLLINEAYVDWRVAQPVRLLVGRRRLVWGSGIAANPTDLLSPPKNPLDVDQQRMGAFLLPVVDLTLGPITLSGLWSPPVTTNRYAVPVAFDLDASLVATRLYSLVFDADANLVYYHDFGHQREHLGFSLSYVLTDYVEVHAEAMSRLGGSATSILPAIPICGASPNSAGRIGGSALAGARLLGSDNSFFVAEYLVNADGLDGRGFASLRTQLPCIRAALRSAPPPAQHAVGHPIDPAFLLLRRHYVMAAYQRPHLTSRTFEDVSVAAAATVGVEDLSTITMGRVGYRFNDQATLAVQLIWFAGLGDSESRLFPTRFATSIDLQIAY